MRLQRIYASHCSGLQDYASILEHLVERWEVPDLKNLSPEAEHAQQYVCSLAPRIRRLAERTLLRKEKGKKQDVPFSWVYDRTIKMYVTLPCPQTDKMLVSPCGLLCFSHVDCLCGVRVHQNEVILLLLQFSICCACDCRFLSCICCSCM